MRTVTLWNQGIVLEPTDWKFRRSNGSDNDVDADWNIVSPGHMILFKTDEGGHVTSQMKLSEYISTMEAFGPERKFADGSITKPFYLAGDDGIVWTGTFHVKPPDEERNDHS